MILYTYDDLSEEQARRMEEATGRSVVQSKIAMLDEGQKEQVEILVTYGNYDDSISDWELASLPNLKWVQSMSSGVEQLPLGQMADRGILLSSAKGVHAIPISEYAIAMILHFAKKVDKFQYLKQSMVWGQSEDLYELYGKTIGILGTGNIGVEIARKAKAFGMKTLGVNSSGRAVEYFDEVYSIGQIDQLLPLCEYVCSVLPSNPQTQNLMNRERIALMKDGVVFVNVGRGDLLDEEELMEALRSGKIAGAALDVFRDEPLPFHHPLWQMEKLIITPHASSKTDMYIERCMDIFLRNYELYQSGQRTGLVNQISLP